MVKKKIDNRIRVMIENGVKLGHRSMFVIVGDKGRDQVILLIFSSKVINERVYFPLGANFIRHSDQILGPVTPDCPMVLQKQRRCHF
jgi:hypothetical protein